MERCPKSGYNVKNQNRDKALRLQDYEIKAIKDSFVSTFKSGKIYLFGSRTDDSKKGGDIDLFIETESEDNLYHKKIDFLVSVKSRIGDQKIDVVLSKDKNRIIEKEALSKGIQL